MRAAVVGFCVLAACSVVPEQPVVEARVAVTIEFEPPLQEPGELHYAHECGEQGTVRTGRSGVTLSMPPGPVALTLRADGGTWEVVFRVETAQPFVWRLPR